ncbi:MAG: ribbon-helix-helix protein, CopG family [Chloroflexi bacterium]|nr:ribbon-helix-helix protein, CopG family [Chloroflexota bacterium]
MAARLEVRLDEERKQRLDMLVETAGIPTSEVVRRLIDEAWEAVMLERRKAAVERLAALEVEDVPDPDVLSRQLVKAYEPLP